MPRYTIVIDEKIYQELNKLAGEETARRKQSILWSKLARDILANYVAQRKTNGIKPKPPIP